jgi:hypothetical protein
VDHSNPKDLSLEVAAFGFEEFVHLKNVVDVVRDLVVGETVDEEKN